MGVKGKWARFFIGRRDVSAVTASAEIDIGVTNEEVTSFQATAKEYTVTGTESSISLSGYVEVLSTAGLERTLQSRFGTALVDHIGVLLQEDGVTELAMPVYVIKDTDPDSMTIAAPATGIMTIDGVFSVREMSIKRGLLLYRGTVTSTGVKSAFDFPAGGTAGGDVFVWVQDITGTATNAELVIASATAEGGTFTNEATITFSDLGSYYAAMTGTVDKRLRLSVNSLGGATNFTIAVVAAITGVTQPA